MINSDFLSTTIHLSFPPRVKRGINSGGNLGFAVVGVITNYPNITLIPKLQFLAAVCACPLRQVENPPTEVLAWPLEGYHQQP